MEGGSEDEFVIADARALHQILEVGEVHGRPGALGCVVDEHVFDVLLQLNHGVFNLLHFKLGLDELVQLPLFAVELKDHLHHGLAVRLVLVEHGLLLLEGPLYNDLLAQLGVQRNRLVSGLG